MKFTIPTVVLFAAALTTSSSASELTIGRWCDVLVRSMDLTQIIEFSLMSDGSIVSRSFFSDGSSREAHLEELGNETYAEIDASFGEKFRIVPSSGDLQLIDDDGLISTARRLENTPRDGECR